MNDNATPKEQSLSRKITLDLDDLFKKLKRASCGFSRRLYQYSRFSRIYSSEGKTYLRLIMISGDFIDITLKVEQTYSIDIVFDLYDFIKKIFKHENSENNKFLSDFFAFRKDSGIRGERKNTEEKKRAFCFSKSNIVIQKISDVFFVFKEKDSIIQINTFNEDDRIFKNNDILHDFLFKDTFFSFDKNKEIVARLPYGPLLKITNFFLDESRSSSKIRTRSNTSGDQYTRIYSLNMFLSRSSSGGKIARFGTEAFFFCDIGKLSKEMGTKSPEIIKETAISIYSIRFLDFLAVPKKNIDKMVDVYKTDYGIFVHMDDVGNSFLMSKISRRYGLSETRERVDVFYKTAIEAIAKKKEAVLEKFKIQTSDFVDLIKSAIAGGLIQKIFSPQRTPGTFYIKRTHDNRIMIGFDSDKTDSKVRSIFNRTFQKNNEGTLEMLSSCNVSDLADMDDFLKTRDDTMLNEREFYRDFYTKKTSDLFTIKNNIFMSYFRVHMLKEQGVDYKDDDATPFDVFSSCFGKSTGITIYGEQCFSIYLIMIESPMATVYYRNGGNIADFVFNMMDVKYMEQW